LRSFLNDALAFTGSSGRQENMTMSALLLLLLLVIIIIIIIIIILQYGAEPSCQTMRALNERIWLGKRD